MSLCLLLFIFSGLYNYGEGEDDLPFTTLAYADGPGGELELESYNKSGRRRDLSNVDTGEIYPMAQYVQQCHLKTKLSILYCQDGHQAVCMPYMVYMFCMPSFSDVLWKHVKMVSTKKPPSTGDRVYCYNQIP